MGVIIIMTGTTRLLSVVSMSVMDQTSKTSSSSPTTLKRSSSVNPISGFALAILRVDLGVRPRESRGWKILSVRTPSPQDSHLPLYHILEFILGIHSGNHSRNHSRNKHRTKYRTKYVLFTRFRYVF